MDPLRFGRQYRALRVHQGRRQQDVSDESGLSRSLIAAIDRGQIEGVTIGALVRAARALDADVDLRLWWRGGGLDRLVDEAHAAIVEAIVARLRRHGWLVEIEVSFSIWGERGSIDVLAFHPGRGALLVVEVKSAITDSQATIHGLDRKARLALEIVGDRPWAVRHVSRLLDVGDTDRSRRRVAGLGVTYGTAFPVGGRAVRRWLADPAAALPAGLLFVSYDSHGSTTRTSAGRERVRRPRKGARGASRARMTATPAFEPNLARPNQPAATDDRPRGDSAVLAVECAKTEWGRRPPRGDGRQAQARWGSRSDARAWGRRPPSGDCPCSEPCAIVRARLAPGRWAFACRSSHGNTFVRRGQP